MSDVDNFIAAIKESEREEGILPNGKKYQLTDNIRIAVNEKGEEVKVRRIMALRDFSDVRKGDLGGFIEKEENLSHYDNCWVYDNSYVYDNAKVIENAIVTDSAEVYGNAIITGSAAVQDEAEVYGNAQIHNESIVKDKAKVYGHACLYNYVSVGGDSEVYGCAVVEHGSSIIGHSDVFGTCVIAEGATIDNSKISGSCKIVGGLTISTSIIYDRANIQSRSGTIVDSSIHGYAKIHTKKCTIGDSVITDHCCIVHEPTIIDSHIGGTAYIDGLTEIDTSRIEGPVCIVGSKIDHSTLNQDVTIKFGKIVQDNAIILHNLIFDGYSIPFYFSIHDNDIRCYDRRRATFYSLEDFKKEIKIAIESCDITRSEYRYALKTLKLVQSKLNKSIGVM